MSICQMPMRPFSSSREQTALQFHYIPQSMPMKPIKQKHDPSFKFQSHSGSNASESSSLVDAVSCIFSNSFGINPKTQQPYRLGPKTTKKRLALAHRLFLASDEADHFVGYLFATEIASSSHGAVGWINSLAVLRQHRRKGVGTRLVENLPSTLRMFAGLGVQPQIP